jgi:RNAse (barnase) inhibitor barstar
MAHIQVDIDTRTITDWDSFHSVFAATFGFTDFYGRNMNAWIDCLTYIDDPDDAMTRIHAPSGGVVVIHLEHARDFRNRCPELFDAIVKCSSFVNYRRTEDGGEPVLVLSFHE